MFIYPWHSMSFTECPRWKLVPRLVAKSMTKKVEQSNSASQSSTPHCSRLTISQGVPQNLAIRTASLPSSFWNKPYCETKITPIPSFLTHPVLSWNHSPQNEYKGDSCRVVALQTWKLCSVIVAWTSWCVPLNTSSPSVPFTSLAYFLAEVLLTPPPFSRKNSIQEFIPARISRNVGRRQRRGRKNTASHRANLSRKAL